jgi:hypothetical protein
MTAGELNTETDLFYPFRVGQYSTPMMGQFSMPVFIEIRTAVPSLESTHGWSGIVHLIDNGLLAARCGSTTRRLKACRNEFVAIKPKQRSFFSPAAFTLHSLEIAKFMFIKA